MKEREKVKKSTQRGRKRQLKEGLGKGRKKIRDEIIRNRNIAGREREKKSKKKNANIKRKE